MKELGTAAKEQLLPMDNKTISKGQQSKSTTSRWSCKNHSQGRGKGSNRWSIRKMKKKTNEFLFVLVFAHGQYSSMFINLFE